MVRLKIAYWEFDFEAVYPTLDHDLLSQAQISNTEYLLIYIFNFVVVYFVLGDYVFCFQILEVCVSAPLFCESTLTWMRASKNQIWCAQVNTKAAPSWE